MSVDSYEFWETRECAGARGHGVGGASGGPRKSRDPAVGGASGSFWGRFPVCVCGLAATAPCSFARTLARSNPSPGLQSSSCRARHGPPQSQRAARFREDVQAGPERPAHRGDALPKGVGGEVRAGHGRRGARGGGVPLLAALRGSIPGLRGQASLEEARAASSGCIAGCLQLPRTPRSPPGEAQLIARCKTPLETCKCLALSVFLSVCPRPADRRSP